MSQSLSAIIHGNLRRIRGVEGEALWHGRSGTSTVACGNLSCGTSGLALRLFSSFASPSWVSEVGIRLSWGVFGLRCCGIWRKRMVFAFSVVVGGISENGVLLGGNLL